MRPVYMKKSTNHAALVTRITLKQTIIDSDSDYETGIYEKKKKSRCSRYKDYIKTDYDTLGL